MRTLNSSYRHKEEIIPMRIITVQIPKPMLKDVAALVGKKKGSQFPSRSELIRYAVRDFLLVELTSLEYFADTEPQKHKVIELPDDSKVMIPIREVDGVVQYKTYKLVRRSEQDD